MKNMSSNQVTVGMKALTQKATHSNAFSSSGVIFFKLSLQHKSNPTFYMCFLFKRSAKLANMASKHTVTYSSAPCLSIHATALQTDSGWNAALQFGSDQSLPLEHVSLISGVEAV